MYRERRWKHLMSTVCATLLAVQCLASGTPVVADSGKTQGNFDATGLRAPAGDLPATRDTVIDGVSGAILPNGRFITPTGVEVSVDAPKPFGMALSPDGKMLATINSGASKFSITLIRNLTSASPQATRINVNATFMGVVFSPDSKRFYASGGENGNIWVGDTATNTIIGSVNLNGPLHPLTFPNGIGSNPDPRFKGAFPGNMAISGNGTYLYVVDQGSFQVFIIDTSKIVTGTTGANQLKDANSFAAVAGSVPAGRYPYGIALSPDDKKLIVTNVGVFQYAHLGPASPSGDPNVDFPLCYPGAGYPDETENARLLKIKKVDPRNLPVTLRDPEGIRCGYIAQDLQFTIPGLGSPNVQESSSVYVFDVTQPTAPVKVQIVKTGPLVGENTDGIVAYSGSHPNSVVVGPNAVYVANGNDDTVSVLDRNTYQELERISLSTLQAVTEQRVKGIQPVALALSPDNKYLYVAEPGINAVGVIQLVGNGKSGHRIGHIPVGWWPSGVRVSPDGKTLYVANARGRGAGPNLVSESTTHPKHSTIGSVSIIPLPSRKELQTLTERVINNNGTEDHLANDDDHPIPSTVGKASTKIKHVIFINKENATHDLFLGHILATRKGVPVNGEPKFSLGQEAVPNHQELALSYAFSDNFYLEPTVSSDGHRWLTNTYPSEFEETHWPASYGGQRRDAGDDQEVIKNYPGRLGFTDANSSPEPNDYNQHGGIYMHLARHGKSFINFGNGFEFAIVDEDFGTEPTGIRHHVNVPMEKIVRDNSDHLYPEYNTHIPDSPLPEDPERFNRFGRFKQVFEAHYVDRASNECKLPSYVDLYYPNDHGGGANDIYPGDPTKTWSFKRFVQDNDVALGLTVELISNSPCWTDTVIFVVEDDTQSGLDHVDGHRSIFLAISPWVKHEYVSKTHTSLASIFKTVNLIFGLPPLNQYDAAATDLRDLFTTTPDFTPYSVQPVQYVKKANKTWLAMTAGIDFSRPDLDELRLRAAILKSEGLPRKSASLNVKPRARRVVKEQRIASVRK